MKPKSIAPVTKIQNPAMTQLRLDNLEKKLNATVSMIGNQVNQNVEAMNLRINKMTLLMRELIEKFEAINSVLIDKKVVAVEECKQALDNIIKQRELMEEAQMEIELNIEDVDRPAQEGDFILYTHQTGVDGVFAPNNKNSRNLIKLEKLSKEGNPEMAGFDAIYEAMFGMKTGESKTVEIDMPKENMPENVAGKRMQYIINVLKVKAPKLQGTNTNEIKQ